MTIHVALTEGEFSLTQSLTFACRLASRLKSDIVGVSAMPDPARAVLMTGVTMHGMAIAAGGTLAEGIREAQDETRKSLEALFNDICEKEGISAGQREIQHHVGMPSEVYPRVTLLTEAFVTPHECVSVGNDHGLAFESTLLDRRLPVIACSKEENPTLETVIIAWDGSPQAARAVRFHTGILKSADRILIAQNEERIDVEDRNGSEDPEVVQDYLKKLGLESDVRTFNGKIAAGLLKLAEDETAGVIVAGAYGHSRIEQLIFGGVSRNLLRAETGPALALAH